MLRPFRSLLRDVASHALAALGVTDPARWSRDRLTVVTFHRVLPTELRAQYPLPGLVVTPGELDWFLSQFKRRFRCGPLSESLDRWLRREGGPPPLAITFDDGQLDNYEHARVVLRRHGVKASFFVPVSGVEGGGLLWHDQLGFPLLSLRREGRSALPSLLGRELDEGCAGAELVRRVMGHAKGLDAAARQDLIAEVRTLAGEPATPPWASMMSWDQVRAMARDGHEIGSHTMTHPLLPECSEAELDFEVGGSRERLQQELDTEVTAFCYPNGDNDARVVEAVRRAGYRAAVTTDWGTNRDRRQVLRLRRCDLDAEHLRGLGGGLSAPLLAWRMSGLYPGL